MLGIRSPLGAPGSSGPVDTVEQLAHRDDADRPIFVSRERFKDLSAPFGVDEDAGVD
jgi:hypothetical protein